MWKQLLQIWRSSNLLTQAWDESYEALEIDRRMFNEAVRVLRESDDDKVDEEIRKLDVQVNRYERDVRRKVMTHCTLVGTSELTPGMVLISIVIDIERIGDYCKNILDLASDHPQRLVVPAYEKQLVDIETGIKECFEQVVVTLREQDEEHAREMMNSYRNYVSDVCDQIVSDVVQGKTDGLSPGDAAALALYARFLKRISAHLKNILSSVVNPFHRIGYKEKKKKAD
jgi:phosphate transport system protein